MIFQIFAIYLFSKYINKYEPKKALEIIIEFQEQILILRF